MLNSLWVIIPIAFNNPAVVIIPEGKGRATIAFETAMSCCG
jgi:hypothetical protein